MLQATAGRLNRSNDLRSIRDTIAEELGGIVDYHSLRIFLLREGKLLPLALKGTHDLYTDEQLSEWVLDLGQGITGWVALHGEALRLDDAAADPRSEHVAGTEHIAESMLAVPIQYESRVLGVMTLSKLGLGQFTDTDLQMLAALADQAATALRNLELFERLQAEAEALRKSEEQLQTITDSLRDMISVLSSDGLYQYVSPSHEATSGYSQAELIGRPALDLVHDDDREAARTAFAELGDFGGSCHVELRFRKKDGEYIWLDTIANVIGDGTDPARGLVVSSRDITARKRAEEQLEYQAFHDPLTDLPNRALFLDRLEHALSRNRRSGTHSAVLFLDLDRFKVINDSLGHEVGDLLLVATAKRLRGCLRPQDTIARLGGDEFTILIEDVADVYEAVGAANRVLQELRRPFRILDHEIFVTTSVGITLGPGTDQRPGDLLRDADLAMYRAKERGKSRYEVYDTSMNTRAVERLALETDLRRAMERGEFRVHYQPAYALTTDRLIGFEALLRWDHPERGLVAPADFIWLAEETDVIMSVGGWVLEHACLQTTEWLRSAGPGVGPLKVAVNLSARQFQHPDLVRQITRVLRATGLPPQSLVLEITEGVVMQDTRTNIHTLVRLKQLGVQIAIDDFGTGYSSLAYLKRLPADVLKVDKSFIEALEQETGDVAIVRAIVTLGKTLGMQVMAEGVETEGQKRALLELGCEVGQGEYLGAPLPAEAVAPLLRRSAPELLVPPPTHR